MGITNQFSVPARNFLLMGFAIVSLTACGGGEKNVADTSGKSDSSASDTASKAAHDAWIAASGPLVDLNITPAEIPPTLKKIARNPYARPAKMKCDAVKQEVAELDDLLGPDVQISDILPTSATDEDASIVGNVQNAEMPTGEELMEGGGNIAHDLAMGVIKSHTSFLPFRSVIRKITGADRHAKDVAKAYQAGQLRRAYLKGLAEDRFGKRCLAPVPIVEARVDKTAIAKLESDPNADQ